MADDIEFFECIEPVAGQPAAGVLEDGLFDRRPPAGLGYLADINCHPRDALIMFADATHTYSTIEDDGEQRPVDKSVTEFIDQYKEPFAANLVIFRMMRGRNWPREGYEVSDGNGGERPMNKEEIKAKWEFEKNDAANRGTYLHHLCEWLLSDPRTMLFIPELRNFFDFYERIIQGLGATTHRLEWRIFDSGLNLAGSIDFVGKLPDGTFLIADWKRAKELKREAYGGKKMKDPFKMLPDSNFGHYTLQLNIYKMLLLRNYHDVIHDISRMLIVLLHPGCNEVVEVEDLKLGVVGGLICPYQES